MKPVDPTRQALRRYTEGLQSQDLTRLFSRDAAQAYSVLTREQGKDGETGVFHRVKTVFLGMSYHLGPARRLLFCLTIVFTLLGMFDFNLVSIPGLPDIDSDPWLHLLAIAGLVFLLALELVDRVRIRDELEIARQLQREILPTAAPPTAGYSFSHSYRTAQEIGGDYYDFLPTADGRLALVAGDASGHGIAAGLLMVIASSTLKLAIDIDPRPERVVPLLNQALCATGGSRAFMTLFYGLLDPETGQLDYICAGHPFPLLRHPGGKVDELGEGSLPLGLRTGIPVRTQQTKLEAGDLLLLYSDGFPEAVRTSDGEAFGFDRIRDHVARGGSPEDLHHRIVQSHRAFLGDEAPHDDVSLVVIGRHPTSVTSAVT